MNITRFDKLRKQRRMAIISLDTSVIGQWLAKGIDHTIETQGIPDNAIYFASNYNGQCQTVDFIYLHESFEIVPEGTQIPALMITVVTKR